LTATKEKKLLAGLVFPAKKIRGRCSHHTRKKKRSCTKGTKTLKSTKKFEGTTKSSVTNEH